MSVFHPSDSNLRQVRCPACGGNSVFAPVNPYRPFCSERCRQLDLGAWANEDFRLATDGPVDDLQPSTREDLQ